MNIYTYESQSENLFALVSATVHAICAATERSLRFNIKAPTSKNSNPSSATNKNNTIGITITNPSNSNSNSNNTNNQMKRKDSAGLDSDADSEFTDIQTVDENSETQSLLHSKNKNMKNINDKSSNSHSSHNLHEHLHLGIIDTGTSIWDHKASVRSYILYSLLETLGLLCLNWSLIFVDKHVLAIFKSNKILLVLIGEVFFLKRDISGLEVLSILMVAVSMMLLSLSELDEFTMFNYAGIPLILIGVIAAAGAPVLAKHYIFQIFAPNRTEVLFFHKFITALLLLLGVAPQLMFLIGTNWFEQVC